MRDHALFTCFAPYRNPKYALSVVVEHGGSGSKVAAPIARYNAFSTLWRYSSNHRYPEKQQLEVRERLFDIAKK